MQRRWVLRRTSGCCRKSRARDGVASGAATGVYSNACMRNLRQTDRGDVAETGLVRGGGVECCDWSAICFDPRAALKAWQVHSHRLTPPVWPGCQRPNRCGRSRGGRGQSGTGDTPVAPRRMKWHVPGASEWHAVSRFGTWLMHPVLPVPPAGTITTSARNPASWLVRSPSPLWPPRLSASSIRRGPDKPWQSPGQDE